VAWRGGFGGYARMACFYILVYFVGVFWGCAPRKHGWWESQSDNDEPKGNSAMEIHLDLPIMAYL